MSVPQLTPRPTYGQNTQNNSNAPPVPPLPAGFRYDVDGYGDSPPHFVDPLVARKQEKEAGLPKTPKTPAFGRGKVPIGQLVAFFDGDKK